MTSNDILKALINPISEEEFLQSLWPKESFYIEGDLARLPPPFSDPLLSTSEYLLKNYTGRIIFGCSDKTQRMIMMERENPQDLYKMGLSLYLVDIAPFFPDLYPFLHSLEQALKLPHGCARATAWIAPKGQGAACHFDPDDVISIQLQGKKYFYVSKEKALDYPIDRQYAFGATPYDESYPQFSKGFPNSDQVPFNKIKMKPGTILFMPRGYWHHTKANEDSFSINIAFSIKSAADVLVEELRNILVQDPEWRRPLYHDTFSNTTLLKKLSQLPQLIEKIGVPELLKPLDKSSITTKSRLQVIPNAVLNVEEIQNQTRISVEVYDCKVLSKQTSLLFTPFNSLSNTITWLKNKKSAFSVNDLLKNIPSSEVNETINLLAQLVSLGFLKLLWFKSKID